MTSNTQGLLLLDKPAGVTSFDCVAVVRRKLAVKRVGHCGTLDPAARRLIHILVGPATREPRLLFGARERISLQRRIETARRLTPIWKEKSSNRKRLIDRRGEEPHWNLHHKDFVGHRADAPWMATPP